MTLRQIADAYVEELAFREKVADDVGTTPDEVIGYAFAKVALLTEEDPLALPELILHVNGKYLRNDELGGRN